MEVVILTCVLLTDPPLLAIYHATMPCRLGDLALEVAQAAGVSEETARKLLERMTCRSDNAFIVIEAAVGEALTALVMLGCVQGRRAALCELARCGATHMVDALDEIARRLERIVCISGTVHSSWYEELIAMNPF
mmetsp:Transcript_44121/g.84321  ORF Transcript_44121/g.84321 Transcript_44121/m.84321 type:complete len:135 (+) Transcript_44121:3066-3470(+)